MSKRIIQEINDGGVYVVFKDGNGYISAMTEIDQDGLISLDTPNNYMAKEKTIKKADAALSDFLYFGDSVADDVDYCVKTIKPTTIFRIISIFPKFIVRIFQKICGKRTNHVWGDTYLDNKNVAKRWCKYCGYMIEGPAREFDLEDFKFFIEKDQ
jgi:hypothetical protein